MYGRVINLYGEIIDRTGVSPQNKSEEKEKGDALTAFLNGDKTTGETGVIIKKISLPLLKKLRDLE
jgi:hypothetical protein